MTDQEADQKNGFILAAGWASLAVYVIYCFELSGAGLARPPANESLVWERARANILLGVNNSFDPCTNIYKNSCERLLNDRSGAFFNAEQRSNWFIENSVAYQACQNNPGVLYNPTPTIEGDSAKPGGPLYNAFMTGCTFANMSVTVQLIDNVYRLVIDTTNTASPIYSEDPPDCLDSLGNINTDDGNVVFGDKKNILFGSNICSAFSVAAPSVCKNVNTCKDYTLSFFPESLNTYTTISPTLAAKLSTTINTAMGSSRKINFGGGPHWVRDAEDQMIGANASELLLDRQTRIFGLIGSTGVGAWEMPATAVNAYYSLDNDAVYIAGGLLVEPFFHNEYPWEHNLAGLGFIIAHEIGHSFGPRAAHKFNRTNTTEIVTRLVANLTEKAGHTAQLYGSELFADWKGSTALDKLVPRPTKLFFHHMAQAWCQRHQQWYTNDPHPPHRWRVNMSIGVFRSFKSVFDCY